MTLTAQLSQFAYEFSRRCPPGWGSQLESAIDQMQAADATRPTFVGETAPDWTLPTIEGDAVQLAAALRNGPVILSFFRGGWCPYCALELRAYEAIWPKIRRAGVQLFGISSEVLESAQATAFAHDLSFPLLHDANYAVADAYGLTFEPPDDLRPLMTELGHALEEVNENGAPYLSIPATYVIASSGRITHAQVDMDYRKRLEPKHALSEAQQCLRGLD